MKIVMLAGSGNSTLFMYNELKNHFCISKVIIEDNPSKTKMLLRRIHNIGIIKVLGQIIFIIFSKFICKLSKSKIMKLKAELSLCDKEIEESIVVKVKSVNSDKTKQLLKAINPDVVVVNGTRIISNNILNSIDANFLNTHMGITPKYRGVHGGYWALVNDDEENCGTTVHLVDTGIDTGDILYQQTIKISKSDNFCTYPLLQIRIGIDMMLNALHDIELDKMNIIHNDLESKFWYHPDIFTYLKNWIIKGVK